VRLEDILSFHLPLRTQSWLAIGVAGSTLPMSSQLQADAKRIPVHHNGLTKPWTMAILLRAAGKLPHPACRVDCGSVCHVDLYTSSHAAQHGCLCILCRLSMLLVDPLGHMGGFNDSASCWLTSWWLA
jgi:hypothetical protein